MDSAPHCKPGATALPGAAGDHRPSGRVAPHAEITLTAPLSCTTRVLGAAATASTRLPAGSVLTFDGARLGRARLEVFLYDRALGIVVDGETYLAVVDDGTARRHARSRPYRALTGRA